VKAAVPGQEHPVIYDQDPNNADNAVFIQVADLPNQVWYNSLPQRQQQRLQVMAGDPEGMWGVAEAIARARNTVVAAVDGGAGKPEIDFLAAAYHLRDHLSAYDLVMNVQLVSNMLTQRNITPGPALDLVKGSITGFGQHVAQTELFIPHPGPWALDAGVTGLAACIEHVLGAQSTAYVLTDNEPDSGHSQRLAANLAALNNAHASQPGYLPLAITINDPAVQTVPNQTLTQAVKYTTIGGVTMELRHHGDFKLVQVTR
jgi:hypothetical protein